MALREGRGLGDLTWSEARASEEQQLSSVQDFRRHLQLASPQMRPARSLKRYWRRRGSFFRHALTFGVVRVSGLLPDDHRGGAMR